MTSPSTEVADTLIHARWIVPIEPANTVLEHHSLAISERKIVALLPTEQARQNWQAKQEVTLATHALMPGLVNAHGHSPMALLRGVADDLPLMEWLEQHIWPIEGQFVSREFVREGTELAMAEMIACGTTTFADMYFFPDEIAKVAQQVGLRVQLASPVLDFPTAWAQDADEYISKANRLHDDWRSSDLVYTAFGPHAPYTVSDAPLRKIGILAEELDIPIHMHLHETAQEVSAAETADGRRPLARLAELGLVSPRLVAVHATQLTAEERQQLAAHGASVIHCPQSNLKLASGFCRVADLLEAGVNVGLGTDGAASNNDLDMFGEMQTAALLAKAVAQDASALPAARALELATLNGARALGLDHLLGSLVPGKQADIAAVDLNRFNTSPLYNPLSHLVYASHAGQVSHVWCAGRLLLEAGELTTLDPALVRQHAARWQHDIEQNRGSRG